MKHGYKIVFDCIGVEDWRDEDEEWGSWSAEQIIWENDVEQIEWTDKRVYVDYSDLCLVKTERNGIHVGNWRKSLEDGHLRFVTNENVFHPEEVVCWAKL